VIVPVDGLCGEREEGGGAAALAEIGESSAML